MSKYDYLQVQLINRDNTLIILALLVASILLAWLLIRWLPPKVQPILKRSYMIGGLLLYLLTILVTVWKG